MCKSKRKENTKGIQERLCFLLLELLSVCTADFADSRQYGLLASDRVPE